MNSTVNGNTMTGKASAAGYGSYTLTGTRQ